MITNVDYCSIRDPDLFVFPVKSSVSPSLFIHLTWKIICILSSLLTSICFKKQLKYHLLQEPFSLLLLEVSSFDPQPPVLRLSEQAAPGTSSWLQGSLVNSVSLCIISSISGFCCLPLVMLVFSSVWWFLYVCSLSHLRWTVSLSWMLISATAAWLQWLQIRAGHAVEQDKPVVSSPNGNVFN